MIVETKTIEEVGVDLSHLEIDCSSSRDEWLQKRRLKGVGASQVAAALGKSSWLGPYGLWLELARGVVPPTRIKNARNGELLEPAIAAIYAEETGRTVIRFPRWTIISNPDLPGIFFSPDFLVVDRGDGSGPGVIDAKTWEGARFDAPPDDYDLQIQTALAVLGWSWGELAVQVGRQQTRYDVPGDSAKQADLYAGAMKFLELVKTGTAPEVDGTDGTADAIAQVVGSPTIGKSVCLPEEFVALRESLRILKAEKKRNESKIDAITNRFKLAIGDAETFRIFGDDREGSFRVVNVRAHQRAASSSRRLNVPGMKDE